MQLINLKVNFILIWFENCVLIPGGIDGQVQTFAITHIKPHVPVVTL